MKYCTSCGKELNDRAKFCTGCGKKCSEEFVENTQAIPIPQEAPSPEEKPVAETAHQKKVPIVENVTSEEEPLQEAPISHTESEQQKISNDLPKKEKKSLSKGKRILFGILGAILIAAIVMTVLLFRWYTGTEQQVLRALDSGDYDAAVVIMEEDASANESEVLANQLSERIANIQNGFVDGTIEYASAKMELDAIEKLKVDNISAELNTVQTYIDNLNESRTNFAAAESFYTTGDYAEAITNYQLVIEDDANYAAAVEKLTDAVSKYRDAILTKAKEYADAELYSDAIALLNEALEIIPNDTKITEQIRMHEKDNAEKLKADALETAAGYAKSGDYLNAFKALTSIMKSQATDAELVSAYNKYCDQYASQVADEVDTMVADKNFDGAIAALNTALKNLPENEAITEKIDEVNSKKPVLLSAMDTINGGWTWNEGSPKDPFGNDYSTASNYAIFYLTTNGQYNGNLNIGSDRYGSYQSYAEYRLYGKYTSVSVDIAPYTEIGEDSFAYIQIYADDVLVYTSVEVDRKTDCFTCTVDISGAEYIEIQVISSYYGALILSNAQLWP